jgi:hypothetical protein
MLLMTRALASVLLALSLACAGAPHDAAALAPRVGAISWEEALALLRSGEVRRVAQTHALDVTLETRTGARYTAREPAIDAVLRAVREQAPNADEIAIATE